MPFPLLGAISGIGALGGLFSGNRAAKEQRDLQRQQLEIGRAQLGMFNNVRPTYEQGVGQLARSAMLEPRDAQGLTSQDRAMYTQAEQDIGRQRQQSGNRLGFELQKRGLNQGAQAALLGRNERDYGNQLASYRRGLVANAPNLQMQRMQQLFGALGPGLAGAGQASGILGQQAGQAGQQAQAGYGQVGGIAQDWMQQRAQDRYMQQYGSGNKVGGYRTSQDYSSKF